MGAMDLISTNDFSADRAVPAFNFTLRVEGIYDIACRAVKGIRRENEFEEIQEGGLNDYVHLKRKPISKRFTFQIERYVGYSQIEALNSIDPLALGTELVLPVVLFVNKNIGGVSALAERIYVFTGCIVQGKEYSDLNAEKSELIVETDTIAYNELICIDTPSFIT